MEIDGNNIKTDIVEYEKDDDIDEIETDDMAIANVLATLPEDSGASISIHRQGAGGHKDLSFVTECLPDEFSLARLQEEYGGGKYRIHVRAKGKLIANRTIQIEKKKVESVDRSGVNDQIAQLSDSVRKLSEIVMARAEPKERTTLEVLTELKLMKEVLGGGAQETLPAQDPFELVTKALNLTQTLNGMTGGEGKGGGVDTMSILLKAIESFGPTLAQAVAAKNAQQAQMVMQAPPQEVTMQEPLLPQVPVTSQEEAMQQSDQNEVFEEKQLIGFYLSELVNRAQRGTDPRTYAEVVLDSIEGLDDEKYAKMMGLLEPDDWWEKLCAINDDIRPYSTWFANMRDAILEALTDDEVPDTSAKVDKSAKSKNASSGAAKSNVKKDS